MVNKTPLLISACLSGQNVRYNGRNCALPKEVLSELSKTYQIFCICPEMAGGLPCPRSAAEICSKANRPIVVTQDGKNVTKNFESGAQVALNLCKDNKIRLALLKDKSPSCGVGCIYDGSFSGKIVSGKGFTAQLLEQNGIRLISEQEVALLLKEQQKGADLK